MSRSCECGDVEDEHGGDPDHPGSSACNVEGCGCVAFEASAREYPTDDVLLKVGRGVFDIFVDIGECPFCNPSAVSGFILHEKDCPLEGTRVPA